MKSIVIITARGGSKRIPKKNIKDFCGKPIIAYSIEAALKSKLFDEVMVSTDSEEIADVAKQFGADVPFMRSEENSGDFTPTAAVLDEVLAQYKMMEKTFDIMACIYPAAPFVTKEKLRTAVDMLLQTDADSVLPVVQYSYPPKRGIMIREGIASFQYPEYSLTRSQDLEPIYHDCGQFYVFRVKSFEQYHALVMPKTIPYIMPEEQVQDIDNTSDWKIAELKYQAFMDKHE